MSVNKVILVGNLGADPETRTTGGGQSVCNFRIATSEKWTSKDGEKQERTEWHNVTAWGKTGELAQQYLAKGREVYVEGRLQSREYEDKEGVTRKVWDVVADRVVFLSGARSDEQRQTRQEGQGSPARGGWGSGGGQRDNGPPKGNPGGWGKGGGQAAPPQGGHDDDPIPF